MKSLSLGLVALLTTGVLPAIADETMYLDTALKGGYEIQGQSSIVFNRIVDGVNTQFSRVEVIVQKDDLFALCAIDTNLEKNTASERPCSTFK